MTFIFLLIGVCISDVDDPIGAATAPPLGSHLPTNKGTPTHSPSASRSAVTPRTLAATRTPTATPYLGFDSLNVVDKGLSYALIGRQGSRSGITSGSTFHLYLRVASSETSATTAKYLFFKGVNVTRRAIQISNYYWQIEYLLENSNRDPVSVGIAVTMELSFASAQEVCSIHESNGGYTMSHDRQPDWNFTFILGNHDGVTPVKGWSDSDEGIAHGSSFVWTSFPNHRIPSSDSHYAIGYNWQRVTVIGNSQTVLKMLVGHGPP
jgi:hypothetical protein